MNLGELWIGAGAVLASFLALRIALPRDGQVRWWLQNDSAQAYYVCALLCVLGFGIANIVTGLVPG